MQPARMIVSGKWQQQVFTVNLGLFGLYRLPDWVLAQGDCALQRIQCLAVGGRQRQDPSGGVRNIKSEGFTGSRPVGDQLRQIIQPSTAIECCECLDSIQRLGFSLRVIVQLLPVAHSVYLHIEPKHDAFCKRLQ